MSLCAFAGYADQGAVLPNTEGPRTLAVLKSAKEQSFRALGGVCHYIGVGRRPRSFILSSSLQY